MNQNLSPPNQSGKAEVPTLDESLAQLEEALDLFVSKHSDEPIDDAQNSEEGNSITPIGTAQKIPKIVEPAPVAAPVRDESFEQAIRELKQKIASPTGEGIAPATGEVVVRAPDDDQGIVKRRFPLLTDSQRKMILLGVIIAIFFAVIGYLVWQRQKSDELRLAMDKQEAIRLRTLSADPASSLEPIAESSPTILSNSDQGLLENVNQILIAYNPAAANIRYKVEVKEGVVTLNGEVQNQLEKDGVENVIKPLTGIKKIVNNLAIKGLMVASGGNMPMSGPVMYPQVNSAEAKRLEESLKRDLAEGAKRAEEERLRIEQQNAQLTAQKNNPDEAAKQDTSRQVADQQQRQQTAAIHNEEDAAFRKLAEERLKQREREEALKLEQQRNNQEPAPKIESVPPNSASLRSGTVTWRGVVKGVEDIVIRGSSASLQHVSGDMAKDAKGVFSTAVPNAPIGVRLVASSGPSPIRIIQQPSAGNNFTTIVRVGDGNKADGKPHTFTLRWASQ